MPTSVFLHHWLKSDPPTSVFTRTYDLLQWLLPRCERFPKAQRFVVTKRLADAALDFQETIFLANAHSGRTRLTHLQTADAHLNKLRLYHCCCYDCASCCG